MHHGIGVTFGYIGQIKESKGVKLLIESAVKLCSEKHDVKFVFAGSIQDNKFYEGTILPLLQKQPNPIRNRIKFIGFIENIEDFFSQIDVHVALSIAPEAYGRILAEAKLYSRPSIILKSGGMPELIHHKQTGFICESIDVESACIACNYYIENPSFCKEQGQKAHESLVELGITRENFIKTWKSVYK